MSDPITLTNPADGTTWTSGKRGRKPLWVMELEAAGTVIPKKVTGPAAKQRTIPLLPKVPGQLRVWKLVGIAGETGDNDDRQRRYRCMVVAADPAAMIRTANAAFQNPVGESEFKSLWQEVDEELVADIHAAGQDVTKAAVWESVGSGWQQRKSRLTSQAAQ
jgi:hypothetical protein